MILVNSKDVVADRVRDIQAQAVASGRARQPRGIRQPRGARRGLAAWALTRSRRTIKTVEVLGST